MKTFSLLLCLFVSLLLAPASAHAADDASPLPFSVSVGGQAAQVKGGAEAPFATIEKPVAANAALEVGAKDMIIVNIVAADDKGTPTEGASPAILVIQSGNKTTLNRMKDGKS